MWAAGLGAAVGAAQEAPVVLGSVPTAIDIPSIGAHAVVVPLGQDDDGTMQAPHLLVLVFARGLLRNLISRVYFDGEPGNLSDPVLLSIPAARRHTLIAQRDEEDLFRWDVRLQGNDETVFFAW